MIYFFVLSSRLQYTLVFPVLLGISRFKVNMRFMWVFNEIMLGFNCEILLQYCSSYLKFLLDLLLLINLNWKILIQLLEESSHSITHIDTYR